MTTYIQHADIAWQAYDGEAVLVEPREALCRILNDTATCIWEACESPKTEDELVDVLMSHYDVDENTARHDTHELIRELLSRSLIIEKE